MKMTRKQMEAAIKEVKRSVTFMRSCYQEYVDKAQKESDVLKRIMASDHDRGCVRAYDNVLSKIKEQFGDLS